LCIAVAPIYRNGHCSCFMQTPAEVGGLKVDADCAENKPTHRGRLHVVKP